MKRACTPSVTKLIAGKVRNGASVKRACPAVGVPWNTAKGWLAKGRAAELDAEGNPEREEDRIYVAFVEAMEKAKAQWAERAERRVYRAALGDYGGDWKAAAYLLERRYGAEYRLAPLPRQLDGNVGNTNPSGEQASGGDEPIRVLVYPVPMAIGADPKSLRLPTGHALEQVVDTEGEGGEQ